MFVISLNHKTSEAGFREKLAFDEIKRISFLNRLKDEGYTQVVYVSTCNRCEIYSVGKSSKVVSVWADMAGVDIDELKESLLFFDGKGAVNHLFHVAAGFDSMVLGEDEILRQIKDAYQFSKEKGFTDYELNTIFQAAISCSKKIKTKTKISKTAVSIASLAAKKIHGFKPGKKKVMIMGATGDTGNKVLLNLLSYGDCKIYATKHIHHIGNPNVESIPYSEIYDYINQMDVIVSATKSPHYTITAGKLKNIELDDKKRLFVDLAVPRDVDEDVVEFKGIDLITIDDFSAIAKENNVLKKKEKENGESIIEDELDTLLKDLTFHNNREGFELMKTTCKEDFEHFVYKFKDIASAEEFDSFMNVLNKMQEV
ncbi:glutamyl-tRNA reductase [Pseudobutyrivibrio sp. YE44]|uniref:glutamyl-tRNA reductase n=1 Tax=Pseudobutyrivibrio sp. YE44 TaxID=1520802 RepID=UPI000881F8FA|nr:glutamyl-tRNA reductase [Pseudobutyrivibrio sp. YE44]SDB14670.1 glutamyl-tRNA reductase [Pseudobutyrivibrio sp. YE44]